MASRSSAADLVLVGGPVMTMDPARPAAEAVAVRAGRLIAVGDAREVLELAGPRTRRIDLRGRTLLPGFQDAHVHPSFAGLGLMRCPLHEVPATRDDYLRVIRAYADANPEGSGSTATAGTCPRSPAERRLPWTWTGRCRIAPRIFDNRDVHGAWVNSLALARAGITRETPDPPGGRIERDADGNPTGTLHEGAADLVGGLIPVPTPTESVIKGSSSGRRTCIDSGSPPGRTPGSPSPISRPTSPSPNAAS